MKILFLLPLFLMALSGTELVLGTIASKPHKKIELFRALTTYLEEKLNKQASIKPIFAPDMVSMKEKIKNNEMNIFIDSIYATVYMMKHAGSQPLLRRWKNGSATYQSVIMVRKESGISELKGLKNRVVGFEDEYSSSGYYVPKSDMQKIGLRVSPENSAKDGDVKYRFTGGDDDKNPILQLLMGGVDAASTASGVADKLPTESNLVEIYRSNHIPRHVVSFKNIDKKLKDTIIKILLDMDKDKDGQKILEKFEQTTKFEPLTEDDALIISSYLEIME